MPDPKPGLSPRALVSLIGVSALVWGLSILASGAEPVLVGASGPAWSSELHRGDLAPLWRWWAARTDGTSMNPAAGWLATVVLIGCAAATTGVVARMTAREAGPRAGSFAGVAMLLTGSFGPAGGAFALVDAPGWLFWFLVLERIGRAIDDPLAPRRVWAGAALAGVGAWACQAHSERLLAGLALGLALRRPARRAGLLMVSAVVLLCVDFDGWRPFRLVEVVHAQAVQIFPWFWLALTYALVRGWFRWVRRDARLGPGDRLRLGVAAVAWGGLTLDALEEPVLPQWGLIGLATLLPTLGREWARAWDARGWTFRARLGLYGVTSLATLGFLASQTLGGRPSADEPGTRSALSMDVAGFRWDYAAYEPRTASTRGPRPVVLLLHGSSQGGGAFLARANWAAKAEEAGFLVLAPDARPLQPWRPAHPIFNPRVWNSGQHPASHPRSQVDDLAFLDALLADASTRWSIDTRRLYVAGHSSGGAMTFRLAAERPGRFAAIASVSGACYLPESDPGDPVPTLFIVGSKDVILPPRGGLAILPWEIRQTPPLHVSLARWSQALGGWKIPCAYEVGPDDRRIIKYFGPHPDDRRMTVVLLPDHGHAWPGSQGIQAERLLSPSLVPIESIHATDLAWDYFRDRRLPAMIGRDDDPHDRASRLGRSRDGGSETTTLGGSNPRPPA